MSGVYDDTYITVYLQWLYETEWLQDHVQTLPEKSHHSVIYGIREMNSVQILFDQVS
jgi:hypothetical protein